MTKEKKNIGKVIQLIVIILVILVGAYYLRSKMTTLKHLKNMNNEINEEKLKPSNNQINGGKYSKKQDDGTIVNTSEMLKNEKKFAFFEISNMKLIYNGKDTIFTAKVKNTIKVNFLETYVNVIVYKNQDEEYLKVGGIIPTILAEGEETFTVSFVDVDVSDAYDIKFNNKTEEEFQEIVDAKR